MSFCYNLIITSFHEHYDNKYCTHTNAIIPNLISSCLARHLFHLMRLGEAEAVDAERRAASTPVKGAKPLRSTAAIATGLKLLSDRSHY
jgi:hypothetical protein